MAVYKGIFKDCGCRDNQNLFRFDKLNDMEERKKRKDTQPGVADYR